MKTVVSALRFNSVQCPVQKDGFVVISAAWTLCMLFVYEDS